MRSLLDHVIRTGKHVRERAGSAVRRPRIPASAFVSVGRKAGDERITVVIRRDPRTRHVLMLALAASLMVLGFDSARRNPMHKAIIVVPSHEHTVLV